VVQQNQHRKVGKIDSTRLLFSAQFAVCMHPLRMLMLISNFAVSLQAAVLVEYTYAVVKG
jgi:hypothetical protein